MSEIFNQASNGGGIMRVGVSPHMDSRSKECGNDKSPIHSTIFRFVQFLCLYQDKISSFEGGNHGDETGNYRFVCYARISEHPVPA